MMFFAQAPRHLTGLTVAGAGVLAAGLMFALAFRPAPPAAVNPYFEPPRPVQAVRIEHPLAPIFAYWKDPDPGLVVVLSGQMHGYLQPCGCSRPQIGGLERRYELIKQLEAKGWAVSKADLGDLAILPSDPAHGRRILSQVRAKYEASLRMLKEMKYAAVGFGGNEFALSLDDALGIAANTQPPFVLMGNLLDKDSLYPEMFKAWTLDAVNTPPVSASPRTWRVAYVGLVSEAVLSEARKLDHRPDSPLKFFEPPDQALARLLPEVHRSSPDLCILLYQGPMEEALELNRKHKAFQIVLYRDDRDKAPTLAQTVDGVKYVGLGKKGMTVGLAGVFTQADGKLRIEYRGVDLTEPLELPPDQTNPVRERMKDYVAGVYYQKFLEHWPKSAHPRQLDHPEARFAGSASCQQCHPKAYATWQGSKHAQAYESLVKYGLPVVEVRLKEGEAPLRIGRQFDPDCVRCHTTGFNYRSGFVSEAATPFLKGNGCENCHGPASLHVERPNDPNFRQMLRIDKSTAARKCQECHDADNDPKFNRANDPAHSFDAYWQKIRHGKE